MRVLLPPVPTRRLLVGGIATLLCLSGVFLRSCLGDDSLLASLQRELDGRRFIEARLSIDQRHVPCGTAPSSDGTVSKSNCPGDHLAFASLAALSRRALREVRAHGNPDALHTLGLIELLLPSGSPGSAGRAVDYLAAAARLSPRPAPVLADLSAAYLRRAEVAQTPRDLFEAIETASQALALDSLNPAARFNLALALERAGLVEQAAQEWRRAADEPELAWGAEARARLRLLPGLSGIPAPPAETASTAEFRAYTVRAPQEARLLAMDRLLPEWAGAWLRGDLAAAGRRLRAARTIGAALQDQGGDGSVSRIVHTILVHTAHPAILRALATAHVAYGAGEQARNDRRWEDAQAAFQRAVAASLADPELRAWAEYGYRVVRFYTGATGDAQEAFMRIAERADTLRQPALAARARWSLGFVQVRSFEYAPGAAQLRTAARLFERLGEREHLGAVQSLESEAWFALGDVPAAYELLYRGIANLRPYRASLRLHNHLYAISQTTAADGLTRAALRVQEEDVAVTARMDPATHTEALVTRALALVVAGQTERAEAALRAGEQALRRLPNDRWEVEWYHQNARLAQAGMLLPRDPARAAVALDSTVAYFEKSAMYHRLLPALLQRARARTNLGDTHGAIADLDRATLVLDSVGGAIQNSALRAMMLGSARESFDRLVMLRVRAGQPDSALVALERSRSRFTMGARAGPDGPAAGGAGPPPMVLNYALIADTLLLWRVDGGGAKLHRSVVPRDTLLDTLERLRVALELGADEESLRADLAALHGWLIRPVQHGLMRNAPLTIVADGEIAAAPFPALLDPARGRYLIQDYVLRFASTLREARQPPLVPQAPAAGAVFVGDPAFDPRVYPGLSRLQAAAQEVWAAAQLYPGPRVLTDTDATPGALRRVLAGASLLHFAGHAVFDDERPERSYLVLAGGSAGRLSAETLRSMDLHHLNLVVLSACQTQRAHSGRSGGFAGLSGALLEAGAGGVVGSLWRVDDSSTRHLMTEFHRAYVTSGDGANALRSAQLQLLGSSDPSHRSPAAWAGFRYGGR